MELYNKRKKIRKKKNTHMTMMVIPHSNGKDIKNLCLPIWLLKLGVFMCLICVLTIGYFIKGYFHLQYVAIENEQLRKVNTDQSVQLDELKTFTGNMRNELNNLLETDEEIRVKVGLIKPSKQSEQKESSKNIETSSHTLDKYVFMNLGDSQVNGVSAGSSLIQNSNLAFPISNNKNLSNNKSLFFPSRQESTFYSLNNRRIDTEEKTQVIELSISEGETDILVELKEELLKMDNLINEQAETMDKLKIDVEKQLAFQNAIPNARPVQGRVTSNFGWRRNPVSKKGSEFHEGIDFGASYGSPVCAAGDGVVTFSGYKSGWGNIVIISHGYGYVSQYAHNSSLLVKSGKKVKRGQVIARVGSTGRSTGAHLHFGISKNGKWINPKSVLK